MMTLWQPSRSPNTLDWRMRSDAGQRVRSLVIRMRLEELGVGGTSTGPAVKVLARPRHILPYVGWEGPGHGPGPSGDSPGAA